MKTYNEKQLPDGWFLKKVWDVVGNISWVVFDRDGEPQVHEFTKKAAIKSAIDYAQTKGGNK